MSHSLRNHNAKIKDPFFFSTAIPAEGLPLFDSHCHLQFAEFAEDREATIARAKAAGLQYLVCPGIDLESSKQAVELAKQFPGFAYAAIGNHPYDADKSLDGFEELLQENLDYIVAIGETGLDYYNSKLDPAIQKASFRAHCELALKYDLPVIIHTRESDECYPDAREVLLALDFKKAIFHCFSGTMPIAQDIWKHNWKTSFALNITYPKNSELREIAESCPVHLKLVETDSPYLSPQGKRGKRNEPGNLGGL